MQICLSSDERYEWKGERWNYKLSMLSEAGNVNFYKMLEIKELIKD